MADEEEKEDKKEAPEKSAGGKTGIITWIIIAIKARNISTI